MEFDAVLLPPRRDTDAGCRGFWHERTINDALDACLARCPDKLALIRGQRYGERVRGAALTSATASWHAMADRIAVGLARLGVGRGDVVACQLPNWWQFS